jgi:hypothetical protein
VGAGGLLTGLSFFFLLSFFFISSFWLFLLLQSWVLKKKIFRGAFWFVECVRKEVLFFVQELFREEFSAHAFFSPFWIWLCVLISEVMRILSQTRREVGPSSARDWEGQCHTASVVLLVVDYSLISLRVHTTSSPQNQANLSDQRIYLSRRPFGFPQPLLYSTSPPRHLSSLTKNNRSLHPSSSQYLTPSSLPQILHSPQQHFQLPKRSRRRPLGQKMPSQLYNHKRQSPLPTPPAHHTLPSHPLQSLLIIIMHRKIKWGRRITCKTLLTIPSQILQGRQSSVCKKDKIKGAVGDYHVIGLFNDFL